MNSSMTRIASFSPGRIRIRDLALRNRGRIELDEQALARVDGIGGGLSVACIGVHVGMHRKALFR